MKIRPPGGIITFLSVLWILVGLVYLYFGITTGHGGFFIYVPLLVIPSLLLWVGSCRAANFLIFCLAGAALMSAVKLVLLFTGDGPPLPKIVMAARMVFCAACIPPLWRWSDARNPTGENE